MISMTRIVTLAVVLALAAAVNSLWTNTPHGIPGNDDLGSMSSWYVWSAIGMYPGIPGRAELLLGSPMFSRRSSVARVVKPSRYVLHRRVPIAPYVQSL